MSAKYIILAVILAVSGCGKSPEKGGAKSETADNIQRVVKSAPKDFGGKLTVVSLCSLDGVAGKPASDINIIESRSHVDFEGWGGNVESGKVAQDLWIRFESVADGSTSYLHAPGRKQRPDVAAAHKKPGLVDSGWFVTADLGGVKQGDYKVFLVFSDGTSGLSCDTKRIVRLP